VNDKSYDWFMKLCEVFNLSFFAEEVKTAELLPYEVKELELRPEVITSKDNWRFSLDKGHLHICYKTGLSTPSFIWYHTPEEFQELVRIAKQNQVKAIPLTTQLVARFKHKGKEYTSEPLCNLSYNAIEIVSRDEVQWDSFEQDGDVKLKEKIEGFYVLCVFIPVEDVEILLKEFDEALKKKDSPQKTAAHS
jgi:hypothetical protein